ncbi:small acid-soluble spore protein Tlp [Paenibacillus physcomitrellae]|uniref:Small acid-soluble spore protein Tlp n=1 Tax=Paenibacillus physcomitrellae TaxID=1619311 RepID=A0ABQ1FSB3_9BACL|nr:small acid-soluble spore protein Tlp [Paenibacillus physcomitrellae]GGA26241.1 hypothetical protein GCM10010917_08840 [Paenibacillus physcomitrellae]
MPKPDNREDNAVHLQQHINHTIANLNEAEEYLDEHADEISASEKQEIEAKNDNRRMSLKGFREEIQDESSK